MRKFFLLVLSLLTVMFGLHTPLVTASPRECEAISPWSPVDATRSNAQYDELCKEYFIEPLPTYLMSKKYLRKSLKSAAPNFNPADAFALHSNPSANAIIYLDFDGQTWEAGMWWIGSLGIKAGDTSAGYTLDDNPNQFTEIERNAIFEIWSNVAEDFSMFNVDVTTERPTGDREVVFKSRGSHALILSEAAVQQGCGCGGIAYVDVFESGNAWNYPALNFSKYGNYYAPPVDVAEIISHEVGHNLGLAHDGTTTGIEYYGGHEMWTPIMGAGRGRGIATWSYGGYPFADTRWDQRGGDDDFAQMNLFLDFFTDDHGDDLSSATFVSASQFDELIPGNITTREDKDFFKFTVTEASAGAWELQLIPAAFAPNLDPEMKLYDANGTVLATSNPLVSVPPFYSYITSGLDAFIQQSLSAGTYYLSVDGVGQGSISAATGYDDYASRGNYKLRFGSPLNGVFIDTVLPVAGGRGTAVEVVGANLDSVTGLTLASQAINNFTIASAGKIIFGIPLGVSSGPLVAQTAGGEVSVLEYLTVLPDLVAPTITSISSNSGVLNQIITVTGSNVGSTSSLRLAGQEIAYEVTGRDTLQFRVSAAMSSGKLAITTPGGSVEAQGTFNVLIPPMINSFSPTMSAVGSTIVLSGTNFTSNSTVTFFGGVKASRPSISATQITVRVPRGAQTGPITVSNSLGSSTTLTNFTVVAPAPTISSISPTSARVGATVSVNGANFVNVQSVRLGAINLTYTILSDTRIQFVVPAGAKTSNVVVTTLSGTATSKNQLRIR